MLREKMIYEVYEDGKMVDKGPACDLAERFYATPQQITRAAKTGGMLQWRYNVKAIGMGVQKEYAELDEKIKAEYKKGLKPTAISRNLNTTPETVIYRIRKMKQRGEIT